MAAMVILGFNEFMAVLYNPLWLLLLLLLFLFGRTVYQVRGGGVGGGSGWGGGGVSREQRLAGMAVVLSLESPASAGLPALLHADLRSSDPLLTPTTLAQEMDVEAEMARGLLPGAIALSGKFMPALRKVAAQTVNSAKTFLAEAPTPGQGRGSGGGYGEADGRHGRRGSGDSGGAQGLRARRREVELSEGPAGSYDASTSRFGVEAAAAAAGSRKDD